ncbi:uncharacterized protein LOC142559851 [Dermacentor variabilis]|uniref:uncharacterized protein LOC142559851 n=1 Tax=Dermacentor variabilis TaxID=34621 RepID=UPI003F5B9E13
MAVQGLNGKSAPGPGRVNNKTLKNLDDRSVTILTGYMNKCWREGRIPEQWKRSKAILIPKQGKPLSLENLRPISLTLCVGKVLEHAFLNRINSHLEETEAGLYTEDGNAIPKVNKIKILRMIIEANGANGETSTNLGQPTREHRKVQRSHGCVRPRSSAVRQLLPTSHGRSMPPSLWCRPSVVHHFYASRRKKGAALWALQ